MPKSCYKTFAVYKGDEFKFMGNSKECTAYLGVKWETFKYYLTPAYHRKINKRKATRNNYLTIVRIDDEDEEA